MSIDDGYHSDFPTLAGSNRDDARCLLLALDGENYCLRHIPMEGRSRQRDCLSSGGIMAHTSSCENDAASFHYAQYCTCSVTHVF